MTIASLFFLALASTVQFTGAATDGKKPNPSDGPVIDLLITDNNRSVNVSAGETYTSSIFPRSFHFSVARSGGPRPALIAVWDLGDGNTAYGREIEYTYHKPGIYPVTVTLTDTGGFSSVAQAKIKILEEPHCYKEEGDSACFRLTNSIANVLPYSQEEWTIESNQPKLKFATSLAKPTIQLISKDFTESEVKTDVSGVVHIADTQIKLSKKNLERRGIDLNNEFYLEIDGPSSTGTTISGQTPKFFFGFGSMKITVDQKNTKVFVYNAVANYRKFLTLGEATSIDLSNLPPGVYGVHVISPDRTEIARADITSSAKSAVVNVDFSKLKKK